MSISIRSLGMSTENKITWASQLWLVEFFVGGLITRKPGSKSECFAHMVNVRIFPPHFTEYSYCNRFNRLASWKEDWAGPGTNRSEIDTAQFSNMASLIQHRWCAQVESEVSRQRISNLLIVFRQRHGLLKLCCQILLHSLLLTGSRDLPNGVLRGPLCAPRIEKPENETKQKRIRMG